LTKLTNSWEGFILLKARQHLACIALRRARSCLPVEGTWVFLGSDRRRIKLGSSTMARRLQKAPAESAQSNLTLGTPGKSAKIASSKMPRLAFSQLTSQGQEKMPNGRRAHASGEGQQVLDHRFDDYRSTARSAPSRHIGELGATKMSGAFTERLSERDWRRPALAFDMRDMPSSRGSTGTFSTMDRVVTAPTISDIRMSDLQRTNPASLDRPAELDNWPSTTSAGSNSWLRRLEHFLDVRLASAADKEAKLLAFHECFAQFSELFKLYRPLLSKIYMAYDECINTRKTASVQMSKVEAEVFVLQEKAQEEVRKSAIRVTEQLKDMKDAVAKAEKEKQVALELLADTKKQLEDVHAEMERMRSEHDEIVERARAFCSGYRWILKQVVKTEEPNDMDALETVTLIQKLEAAQTETYAQQKQIDYYKNTANVVYVQNILEEERKAYALETDRITAELDNLRSAESDCRKALEISEDKCTVLETEVKSVNARLNTTFLPHLGDGPDIPEMMRTSHPLVNRKVEKRDVLEILSICMELSLKQFDNGAYPKVEQTFTDAIKAKYEQHTVAEWSRNVLEALETFRDQHECSLLGSLLANTTSSHMLIHRAKASSEAVCALTEISRRQKPFAEEDAEKEGKEASSSVQDEHVPAVDLMKELYSAFPYKTQAHWQELIDLLQSKPFEDHNINISAIARGEHEGADSQLLHLLEKQAVEEVLQYTSEFKAGLIEDASRRKSKKSELRVNVEDVRNRIKIIENQKPDCEVAAMIQRAFGIPSYEKAFQVFAPLGINFKVGKQGLIHVFVLKKSEIFCCWHLQLNPRSCSDVIRTGRRI
jgi:hypothetical protein